MYMESNDFKVGQNYRYSELPSEDTENLTISEYGLEYLGQNAIHLKFHDEDKSVWFIWHSQANEAIMKCVYNN